MPCLLPVDGNINNTPNECVFGFDSGRCDAGFTAAATLTFRGNQFECRKSFGTYVFEVMRRKSRNLRREECSNFFICFWAVYFLSGVNEKMVVYSS